MTKIFVTHGGVHERCMKKGVYLSFSKNKEINIQYVCTISHQGECYIYFSPTKRVYTGKVEDLIHYN